MLGHQRILASYNAWFSGRICNLNTVTQHFERIDHDIANAIDLIVGNTFSMEIVIAVLDDVGGFSFEFTEWRFNIRMSNTEPVVRLNVETRGDQDLLVSKTAEVLAILET